MNFLWAITHCSGILHIIYVVTEQFSVIIPVPTPTPIRQMKKKAI